MAIDYYTSIRKTYPHYAFSSVLFDINNLKQFTYKDLTDDPDGLTDRIADELLMQMKEQGLSEYYNNGYETEVRTLEQADMYFAEDGITVIFPEYSLSTEVAGLQMFLVDYSVINEYLNDYGISMLYEFTGTVG